MNRCLDDPFAYCTGTPERTTNVVSIKYIDFGGQEKITDQAVTQCKLDLQTCTFYRTHNQLHAQLTK